MNRIFIAVALAFVLVSCSSTTKVSVKSKATQLRKYEEVSLTNGLRVMLVEDKKLPYINLSVLVNMGYSQDPKSKSGLTAFMFHMLEKGTSKRNASRISSDLEQMGMSLETDAGADFSKISLDALSWDQETAIKNLAEIVLEPRFADIEIQREKQQFLAAIKKRVDDPSDYSLELFYSYFYGNHPYGKTQIGEARDIRSISRKDLMSHYIKNLNPKNSWLVVTGKFDSNIQPLLEKYFGKWKERDSLDLVFPLVDSPKGIKIKLSHKESLVQSQIILGHKGISRAIPDFLEARIANIILGDGFSSRLVKNVRVKEGLTYSIDSEFDIKKDQGLFMISTFTQNNNVGKTLNEILRTYKEFYLKGVTSDEVREAKNYLSGTFPQIIETPERFAYNVLILRLYGVPDSYLIDFQKNLAKVTTSGVNQAIKKYFDPNNLKVLIYSNKKQVQGQLEGFGEIEIEDTKN